MTFNLKTALSKLLQSGGVFAVVLAVLIFSILPAHADRRTDPLKIQSVTFDATSQAINLSAQNGAVYNGEYQMVKLTHPDRAIIDIPNAFLSTSARSIPIQQNGLDRIELSQSLGTFYQVVRITVFAQNASALQNIQLHPSNNRLTISMNGKPPVMAPPIPGSPSTPNNSRFSFLDGPAPAVDGRNVIRSVSFQNGTLLITANNNNDLIIKNQFTLTQPNRLVLDIANAVLQDKSLANPIDVYRDGIKTIRLGQFDAETVRIVVDADKPSAMAVIYPGHDKSQLALSSNFNHSIRTLPYENQRIGSISDINLVKRGDNSIIRINTTEPMVRRIRRNGNQIELELINIASKPSFVAYDKREFSDIKEIRLSPMNAQEPNSKVIIRVDDPGVEMESASTIDGRSLEISLTPRNRAVVSHHRTQMPELVMPGGALPAVGSVKKGSFTVVVDAGHGGKDIGANREGVYEKHLNLSVAQKVRQALEAKGVTVHMTRATDKFLELSEITAITNRVKPDAFVSVHTNASVSTAANGIETYYYTPQSRELANRVHRRMVNSVSAPDRGVRTARFYVIRNTQVPAILCEMGYISNPSERASLQSESRQRATAEAIAQGVVEFLTRAYKADAAVGE